MSRPLKRLTYMAAMLGFASATHAQSVTEMISLGDNAYDQGNYASAFHFYAQVVDPVSKAERNSAYPYEMMAYTGAGKTRKSAADSSDSFDAQLESLHTVESNRLEKYATHRAAVCVRLLNDYERAEEWYVKALQVTWGDESGDYVRDRYWYATVLMNNGKYGQAAEELVTYMLEAADTSAYYQARAAQLIENIKYAQSPASKDPAWTLRPADTVLNSGSATYAISYFDNTTMLVSSARDGSTEDKGSDMEGMYLSDVFRVRRSGEGWMQPEPLPGAVNSKIHDGATSVTSDRSSIYFTRWPVSKKDAPAIYLSKFFVDKWMEPKKLNEDINVAGFRSMHPSVTRGGDILFFASDRPGGQGGMDIWYVTVDWKGNASDPVNMGPRVNTAEDEVTPFYHDDTRMLYFSSRGHKGIGGYDVFKVYFDTETKKAGAAVHLGSPLNSPRNDLYFVMDPLQKSGFVTSNRDDCAGCSPNGGTRNCNRIYVFDKTENVFMLKGVVTDLDSGDPLPFSRVTVKDVKGEFEPFYLETDSAGRYSLPLEPEMHIFLKAQKLEYFADANVVSTIGISEGKTFTVDFGLGLIPYEEIVISGIYYDYNKATLRPESKKVLDEMVEFLELNDNIIIEISSHTDDRASAEYNMKLSQSRAETVVKYLIDAGISKDRLLAKGYGETLPVVQSALTEEDHQKNRRTSFRTLSEDYKPIDKYRPKR